ncbi:hypothetical protein CS8_024470 [Cupriavidus sp. 8B]
MPNSTSLKSAKWKEIDISHSESLERGDVPSNEAHDEKPSIKARVEVSNRMLNATAQYSLPTSFEISGPYVCSTGNARMVDRGHKSILKIAEWNSILEGIIRNCTQKATSIETPEPDDE